MVRQGWPAGNPDRLLSEAMRFRLEGRTGEAVSRLRRIVAVTPGHAAANIAMADILKAEGAQDDALAALRRAAEAAPSNPTIWSRFVFELRDAGQKSRARKAARAARVPVALRKRLVDIAEGRSAPVDDIGDLIRQGALAEAWRVGTERLKSFPHDDRLLNLLGAAALADDDPVRAEEVLRRAVAEDPSSEAALSNLGLALVRQGRASEAIGLLEPVAGRAGASLDVRVNLASAYFRMDRMQDAADLTERLVREAPADAELLGVRARSLTALGRPAEAVELLEALSEEAGFGLHDVLADAISESKGRVAGLDYLDGLEHLPRETENRLAALLAEWGELDRAAARARRLAEQDHTDPGPFRLYGLCAKWKADDPLIAAMRDGAGSDRIAPMKRGVFGLALAKAHMDQGDHDRAFKALEEGNRTLRSMIDYDVARDVQTMERIAETWTEGATARAGTGLEAPKPIFIVGLPRSGSTLVETILSRHPDVEALGETPLVFDACAAARYSAEPAAVAGVAEAVAGSLTPNPPKRAMTEKLLANFLNIGVLAATFPGARFIEMRRDYRDICTSIFQADLGAMSHPYAMDLEELAQYAVAYDRLMKHWAKVVGERLVRVSYEDLVGAPDVEVPRLVASAGLEWDPACLSQDAPSRRINTMSVAQARKPITSSSVGRWRRFEAGLAPLTRILEENGLVQTP